MPWKTDIERFRLRRTLFEVKRKLEEALRLSRRHSPPSGSEPKDAESTVTHRHR
ncbi:MAG: hypothetical protein JO302_00640 [Candidatus Eremiobacteraeota bacterium]|nr:hypothetical protein [Candidatus Eremiobacteraeota bacterium]